MPVAVGVLAVREEALRHDEVQVVLGARHGDVEQAPLLLDLGGRAGAEIGGDAAVDDIEDEHRFPLLSLGRMDGRQDQIILVLQRRAGFVAGGVRRIEGQLGEEALARGIASGDLLQLHEIGATRCGVLVHAFEVRVVPVAGVGDLRRPAGAADVQRQHCLDEAGPLRLEHARRRRHLVQNGDRMRSFLHAVEDALRRRRTDARHELQEAEAGDAVARVFGKAQQRQQILDVRGVEELQTTELHKGNVALGELDLERARMMRGAEQHGLVLQQGTGLAVLQHALDDVARLVRLIADGNEARALGGLAIGPQVLGEALSGEIDDAVGGGEDRLRRSVVAVEGDDLGRRIEVRREVEDVAHGSGAERINRLRVIADDREAAPVALQRQQDRGLQPVGVLVFIDQHVIETAADVLGDGRVGNHLCPVEQQVVVIEHVLALLGFDVGGEQLLQFLRPRRAPFERRMQHVVDGQLGVDAA